MIVGLTLQTVHTSKKTSTICAILLRCECEQRIMQRNPFLRPPAFAQNLIRKRSGRTVLPR